MKFKLSPDRVYRLLTDSKLHTSLTGQKADISKRIGGAFSVRAGNVTGVTVDLVPGERIVLAWRNKKFPIGIYSMAAIQLSRTNDGGTALVLTHRGVPKDLIPATEKDWRTMYWEKIRLLDS